MTHYQLTMQDICDFVDECGVQGCQWLKDGLYLQCSKWYDLTMKDIDETEAREMERERNDN